MKEVPKEKVIKKLLSNKKASFEYFIINKYEAGIVLQGTEIKSLRKGNASLVDSYCKFENKKSNEIIICNFHINPYEFGTYTNHIPKRPRKLLLNKTELRKIRNGIYEKKYIIIPLSVYLSGHIAKIEIGVCQPKKKYDKREVKKENENKREINRKFKFK
jgi:SsrA-binding protein